MQQTLLVLITGKQQNHLWMQRSEVNIGRCVSVLTLMDPHGASSETGRKYLLAVFFVKAILGEKR
jgi:hypothetical protein